MFPSLLYEHPQGSSFVLSAFTTFRLLASSFACNVNKVNIVSCIQDTV
jgi:hypothetical protein